MPGDPWVLAMYIALQLTNLRADLSEKRPETEADILSRSKRLSSVQVTQTSCSRGRGYTVDLPAHMAQCDENYHRLMQLFPRLRDEKERQIGLPLAAMDAQVVFKVVEKGPYTTLLKLDVSSDEKWLSLAAAPDMSIRVYHDAKSAEVVAYQAQNRFHGKYEYPNQRMRQRDEKVQINRFLGEFLALCLEYGASNQPISF